MAELLEKAEFGSLSIWVILLFLLSVLGIIAAGKPAESFGRLAACAVTYVLCGILFSNASMEPALAAFSRGLEVLPFYRSLSGNGEPAAAMFLHNFTGFTVELFELFALCTSVDISLTVLNFLVTGSKKLGDALVGLVSPFKAKAGGVCGVVVLLFPLAALYLICIAAAFVYAAVYVYALSALPETVILGIALTVFIVVVLMVLSPLVDFLMLWAKVSPNKVIHAVSGFVKEHKLGGGLQVAFFATFLMLSVIVALQAVFPTLTWRI